MGHSPALQKTTQPGAGTVSAEAMARVGMRIGDYEIKGVIGEGGTGVVYRGGHVASDRPVAIKILHDRGAQASSARRSARTIPATPETAPTPAAESEPAQVPATAADLVREAQHGWMRGHHAVAISKAQAVLKAEPTPAQAMQAYELIATCSCAIGRADTAREAASHLGDSKRELVKTACLKNGVTIE